jgi:hypothetical protein
MDSPTQTFNNRYFPATYIVFPSIFHHKVFNIGVLYNWTRPRKHLTIIYVHLDILLPQNIIFPSIFTTKLIILVCFIDGLAHARKHLKIISMHGALITLIFSCCIYYFSFNFHHKIFNIWVLYRWTRPRTQTFR